MLNNATTLLAALIVCCAATAGELTDRYDRFEQKRDLQWLSGVRSADPQAMGLTASVVFNGDQPINVLAHLAGSFERIEYADCNSVHWLADGSPVRPKTSTYRLLQRNQPGAYIEMFTSIFTVDEFVRLARAKVVEYKVCNTEGVIPAEDLDGMRQIAARVGL